ncbi:MAG: hypothetical protein H6534_05300 [Chthonomonadaceae bacterium]|nr:hypothetical protein [Chthonomonadaceae bacterium]
MPKPVSPLFRAAVLTTCAWLALFGAPLAASGRIPPQGFDPIIAMDRYYWPSQNANIVIDLSPDKCPNLVAGRTYTVNLILPAGWLNAPKPFELKGGEKVTKTVRTGTETGSYLVRALVLEGKTQKCEGRFTTQVAPIVVGG